MAKTLRTAALVVGAVALVAATAGAAAGALAPAMAGTAGIGTVSAATLTAVGTYASLAAGALSIAAQAAMPGPTVQGSATTFATNPQSGLPYAMGRTRMSGLRFFAATSNTPGYTKANDLLWFGALLSIGGQIEQIETFKADNVVVSFDAGGNAIGTYRNYMAQKVHLGGPQASAINLSLNGGTRRAGPASTAFPASPMRCGACASTRTGSFTGRALRSPPGSASGSGSMIPGSTAPIPAERARAARWMRALMSGRRTRASMP